MFPYRCSPVCGVAGGELCTDLFAVDFSSSKVPTTVLRNNLFHHPSGYSSKACFHGHFGQNQAPFFTFTVVISKLSGFLLNHVYLRHLILKSRQDQAHFGLIVALQRSLYHIWGGGDAAASSRYCVATC